MKRVRLLSVILVFLLLSDATDNMAQSSTDKDYQLVFSDEFDLPNGSTPNPRYWSCSSRLSCTWARWISHSPRVAYIKNGKLVCRAIRNTFMPSDTAKMLTGAVETQNKFSFKYGKIEVRMKTNLHTGNFPAAWLMPEPPAPNHPDGGEIDIFESFGKNDLAHHTVHTHWTLKLNQTKPSNSFNKKINVKRWHVYGLEWTPNQLIFSIDGKTTGVYMKSSDENALKNGQWPFDRPFYIILNQSLRQFGPSSYGGAPDLSYTYETQFDWVRVFQKKKLK